MTSAETLWVLPDGSPPLSRVIPVLERASGPMDVLLWMGDVDGDSEGYGRAIVLPGNRPVDLTIKAISPRLLRDLARHHAAVVVTLEVDLTALFALLSRVARPKRRIVALIEGDPRQLGQTGSARWKVAFRRLVARFLDGFIANSPDATTYLVDSMRVPREKITEGWWLAGLPEELEAVPPSAQDLARGEGPIFVTVGRLTLLKGQDRLLRAAKAYTDAIGPCRVWIVGDGESRADLEGLAQRLGIDHAVTFFGQRDHAQLKGILQASDAFVFPTLVDLVGRALVEALSVGLPVVVSGESGAVGVLVDDDVNGAIVDAADDTALLGGMVRVTDPASAPALRAGAEATMQRVSVAAAVDVITRGIARATGSAAAEL